MSGESWREADLKAEGYDGIPDHHVTWQTASILHSSWQIERRTVHIMDEGQYKIETQLCVWSYRQLRSKCASWVNKRAKKGGK